MYCCLYWWRYSGPRNEVNTIITWWCVATGTYVRSNKNIHYNCSHLETSSLYLVGKWLILKLIKSVIKSVSFKIWLKKVWKIAETKKDWKWLYMVFVGSPPTYMRIVALAISAFQCSSPKPKQSLLSDGGGLVVNETCNLFSLLPSVPWYSAYHYGISFTYHWLHFRLKKGKQHYLIWPKCTSHQTLKVCLFYQCH